jgi:hypothetical protein
MHQIVSNNCFVREASQDGRDQKCDHQAIHRQVEESQETYRSPLCFRALSEGQDCERADEEEWERQGGGEARRLIEPEDDLLRVCCS